MGCKYFTDVIDLKLFRRVNKITQSELADYLGIGQPFISQIEKGGRPMPPEYISKLLASEQWDTSMLTGEGEMLKTDTPKSGVSTEEGGVISIPSDVWEVIKNQSASLKAKDDQINTLISQSKSEREETVQALKNTISILEKELAKKGEDAGYPSHVAIRADTE
jgi:hypothetical protein